MIGMKHTIAALAIALSLGGCVTSMKHRTAPTAGRITWVVHKTYGDLLAAYASAPGRKQFAGKLGAFATWRGLLMEGGTCEIHTIYPGGYETEHAFGVDMSHEFRHCAEGAFHD